MARRIDAETKEQIVQMYLSGENVKQAEVAKKFGVSVSYVGKIIANNVTAGNGIKPDRRNTKGELADDELDRRHEENMKEHPRTSDWMEHIKPLHKHKMDLEQTVERKRLELEKAKQELRDFTATLRQLMEDTT